MTSEYLRLPPFAASPDRRCAETDPEAFYPDKGATGADAKVVCAGCLLRVECREWAISTAEPWGIWGGTSVKERSQIRKCRDGRCRHAQHRAAA